MNLTPALGPSLRPSLGLAINRGALPGASMSLDSYGPSNPLYIAHRGGALMYPENSVEGFANSYSDGNRVLEMDVQVLSDGALCVMHDDTVDRTTSSTGNVVSFDTAGWQALAIDADAFFGGNFGNNLHAPLFNDIMDSYKGRAILVPEAKATGDGTQLASALTAKGISPKQALVQAFTLSDLPPAVAAGFPALYLTNDDTQIATIQASGVTWIGASSALSAAACANFIAAGFKVAIYTLSRRSDRDLWASRGVSGFFSNDPAYMKANTPFATTDNFAAQRWQHGMVGKTDTLADRGAFTAPDKWGLSPGAIFQSVLHGWASPFKGDPNANSFTLDFKITHGAASGGDTSKWASVFLGKSDAYFNNGNAATAGEQGYHFLFRKSGQFQIYTRGVSATTQVASTFGAAIADGQEVAYRIIATPTNITVQRLNGSGAVAYSATYADTTPDFRGGYLHLNANGCIADFRDITIS